MTLTLALPHFDVEPATQSENCLLCTTPDCNPVDVADLGEGPVRVWSCVTCDKRYTTRFTQLPCPDGHAWCVDHEVEGDGVVFHRSVGAYFQADEDGYLSRDGSIIDVRGVVDVGERGGPIVWIAATPNTSLHALTDGIGISPARARLLGALLTQLANQIEGGEHR